MADLAGLDEEARAAYAAAQRLIAETIQEGGTEISFNDEAFRALTQIPPEIADIKGLTSLNLDRTKVSDLSPIRDLTGLRILSLIQTGISDLSPIRDLTGLQRLRFNQTGVSDLFAIRDLTQLQILSLNQTGASDLSPIRNLTGLSFLSLSQTGVSDLSPIRKLTGLQSLWLDETGVSDLSPIRDLTVLLSLGLSGTGVSDLRHLIHMDQLGDGPLGGLWFDGTPAVQHDPELARLAEIADSGQRTKETLAYLKTLPPWPEPLPWLTNAGSSPPQAPNPQPLRQDPPMTRATAGPKTPAKHIKFLLSQPRLTAFTAKEVAGQIRWALKDVKRATNSLPDPLATIEEIADALDDLGNTRLEPKDKQRVHDLNLRIAQLEAVVEKLTAQLSDSEKARETAEALAKSQGFQGQFMSELATETVRTGGFIVRTGAVGGAIYFLGQASPIVSAMLGVLAALK